MLVPFLKIDLFHEYYSSGKFEEFEIKSSQSTLELMLKLGMRLSFRKGGLTCYYEKEKRDVIKESLDGGIEDLQLVFKIYSTNNCFSNFTDYGSVSKSQVLFFANNTNRKIKREISLIDSVSEKDIVSLDDDKLKGLLTKQEKYCPPIGVIVISLEKIPISKFSKSSMDPTIYQLHFLSRKTQWCFHIVQNELTANDSYEIRDREGCIDFCKPVVTSCLDGLSTVMIKVKDRLPFKERSNLKLELVDTSKRMDRILMKNLPVATPRFIEFENGSKKRMYKTNIFIYY